MSESKESRRQFLTRSATAVAMAALLGCRQVMHRGTTAGPTTKLAGSTTEPTIDSERKLRVNWQDADGSPLDYQRYRLFHVRDLQNDPMPLTIEANGNGATVALANEPIQLTVRLKIPSFGEVYCCADNDGYGYRNAETVDFVTDAAATRIRRVLEAMQVAISEGVALSDAFKARMFDAIETLQSAAPQYDVSAAYRSLSNSMPAGEMLTLERARHRISRLAAPRKDFYFGVALSGAGTNPVFDQRIDQLFDFGSTAWFIWKDTYVADAPVDYARMDQSVNWALANHITPKGYGYTYMARGATPTWARPSEEQLKAAAHGDVTVPGWSFDQLLSLYKQVNEQTLSRYRDKLAYVEVINEAHDKSNLWRFNHEQIIELTRESCAAARRGSPTVKRQINNCCLWAEYAKALNLDGSRKWSPHRYLTECVNAGAEFETIGLQLYYPSYDLFEIERMLDRFKSFGKPLHISEISTASADGQDAASMRPRNAPPGWHGAWSETTQADWAEAIYTICYSKPEFEAVGWWDLADGPNHFWPFGGLLHTDLTPKESYLRLAKLQKDWGVAKA